MIRFLSLAFLPIALSACTCTGAPSTPSVVSERPIHSSVPKLLDVEPVVSLILSSLEIPVGATLLSRAKFHRRASVALNAIRDQELEDEREEHLRIERRLRHKLLHKEPLCLSCRLPLRTPIFDSKTLSLRGIRSAPVRSEEEVDCR